jgi:cytochrome c oxidase cbb3-type subunit IV
MDTGTFRGIITFLLIVAFLGITWWAYSRRRKPDFDEAAKMIFDDDELTNRDSNASPRSPSEQDGEAATRHADSRKDKGDRNT